MGVTGLVVRPNQPDVEKDRPGSPCQTTIPVVGSGAAARQRCIHVKAQSHSL